MRNDLYKATGGMLLKENNQKMGFRLVIFLQPHVEKKFYYFYRSYRMNCYMVYIT